MSLYTATNYILSQLCVAADVYTSNTQIDYESLARTRYTLTARVSDGTSSVSRSLQIDIEDVNEAPVFQTTVYTVTADEGPVSRALLSHGRGSELLYLALVQY